MKLNYKKKGSKINLIAGLFWFIWFWVGRLFILEKTNWYDWGFLIISVLYILLYIYQTRVLYATINDEFIKLNEPFGKKLKISNVKTVRNFAGDYVFKTDKKELTLNTQIITPESLENLNQKVDELGIPWS